MKTLALNLAAMLLLPATMAAATSINEADIEFNASDGTQAIVNVSRNIGGSISGVACPTACTFLAYSFCLKPFVPQCANGYGFIPNSAFKGWISRNPYSTETLTLQVDTSQVAGFLNQICYDPNNDTNATCLGGEVYGTGGVFSITFIKSPIWSNTQSDVGQGIAFGTITKSTHFQGNYALRPTGTALDEAISQYNLVNLFSADFLLVQGSYSQTVTNPALSPRAAGILKKLKGQR